MGEQQRQTVIAAVFACAVVAVVMFGLGIMTGAGGIPDVPKLPENPLVELRDRDREYKLLVEMHNDLHAIRDDVRAIKSAMPRRGVVGEEKE